MLFQVENNPEGYVVSCYHGSSWHPLRNFGDRQGDARIFMESDCPKLDNITIATLEKRYKKNVCYIRLSDKRFKAIEAGNY